MIGCLRTRVRKQPIIAFYFESENELVFYNLKARSGSKLFVTLIVFLKEFLEKVDFEKKKISRLQKSMKTYPVNKATQNVGTH